MENLSKRVIKGYELREQIGTGGFAAVYRAYQFAVDREVAVKVILPKYANTSDFIRRFEAEAQLVARLEHIHIVPLYDYWREPNNAYLVMRWLRGGSLYELIQKHGTWELPMIVQLLDQIATALTVAHRQGVIHQDLTPANILFDEERNAYLTDFGIAKGLFRPIEQPEPHNRLYGSPSYMAPEQIMKEPVTPQTDIYSLGIVLFQLLTGKAPFEAGTVTDVLHQQINEPLPPLASVRPDLPPTLDIVLMKATTKNPARRYADARSLASAFRSSVQAVDENIAVLPSGSVGGMDGADITTRELGIQTRDLSAILALDNPYKGLRAFEEADAAHFFGRTKFVRQLLDHLAQPAPEGNFLAVIGPSGSGKSSVVKAGLIPALRHATLPSSNVWYVAKMVPGAQPLVELETALLSVAVGEITAVHEQLRATEQGLHQVVRQILPDETELVLVIDQFEEVFTLVEDPAEQTHFLDSLFTAVQAPDNRLRVVITLRADFYDRPLLHPGLGELLRAHTEVVLPLSLGELQEVIVGPATHVGLSLEPGLVETIVDNVTQQPGALPLLQYALTELFERREDRRLTLAGYQTSGGVWGALARRAEELYQQMEPAHQTVTRQLFLRLVTLGEGADDTRRRARWAELMSMQADHTPAMQTVLDAYGKYRLITFDRDPQTREPTVEIAHEALIHEWVRFREWLDENREDLSVQRRLATATNEWINTGRDTSFLATGARLVQFEALDAKAQLVLTAEETAYLRASSALRQRVARRLQLFVAALIIFSLVALVLAAFAFDRQRQTEKAQATTVAEQIRADQQAHISRSRELAATALKNIDQIDLSLLLSLEAFQVVDTFEARNSLLTTLQSNPRLSGVLHGQAEAVRSIAFSPDGQWLASGNRDGLIMLWDTAQRTVKTTFAGHTDVVNSAIFSPDGTMLATGSGDGTVRRWDVASGKPIGSPLVAHAAETEDDHAVWSAAFSPDGTLLVSGHADGTIMLWDAYTGDRVGDAWAEHTDEVFSVAFSPDGSLLASGGADNTLRLWDVASGEVLTELTGHENWIFSVAFSPDGSLLASGGADNTLRLWDVASRELVLQPLVGHTNWVRSVIFSPSGRVLITGDADGVTRLWDVTSGQLLIQPLIGHHGQVWAVAINPAGTMLATASSDTTIMLWDVTSQYPLKHYLNGHFNEISAVAFSPDGQLVASASGAPSGVGKDLSIRLWDATSGEQRAILTGHSGLVSAIAFSPDGQLIASSSIDQTIRLWDVQTGAAVGEPLTGHTAPILTLAFNVGGQTIASGSEDGTIMVWDVTTGDPIGEPLTGHTDSVESVAFSPDGTLLASGSRDTTVMLWNVTRGQPVREPLTSHTDRVQSVAFSPDGQLLASGSRDATVILWDVASGQPVRAPLTGHANYVSSVVFSPEGQLLASGSRDATIILWEVATGRPIGQPFTGHQQWVNSVAFSPDGHTLASGSWDMAVILWDVDLASWQTRACEIANRNLTAEEWERYFQPATYHATCSSQSSS